MSVKALSCHNNGIVHVGVCQLPFGEALQSCGSSDDESNEDEA